MASKGVIQICHSEESLVAETAFWANSAGYELVSANGRETLHEGAFEHSDQSLPDWPGAVTPASAWISNVAGAAVTARISGLIDAVWPGLPHKLVRAQARRDRYP